MIKYLLMNYERIRCMEKNRAFTLAEILITLAIIGVVAMTMPIIVENYRLKQLETGLKKSYSVIAQALDMYFAETGERVTSENTDWGEMKTILMQYLSVFHDCGYGHEDSDTACVQNYIDTEKNSQTYKNFTDTSNINLNYTDDGQLILSDGSFILIENYTHLFISVDVNGLYKRPNRLGHDLFMFQIDEEGALLPMGKDGTNYNSKNYCSETSTNSMNGAGCTYKALTEKDYFKNLPK